MLNPFEKISIPNDPETVIKTILNRIPKINGNTPKDREIRRIKYVVEQVRKYRVFLDTFPKISDLHPFYRELLEITSGDIGHFQRCLSAIRKSVLLAEKLSDEYISLIKRDPQNRPNKYLRQYVGRVFSVLRKRKECIDLVIRISKELKKLQTIDPYLPTIIVAGPPNVGKSSLVSKISSAKPEIASYPFTTKEIHVGHITSGILTVQVIDTPGILDRPMKDRNVVELKAINAIKNLNGIILFLFDASNSSMYTYKEQLDLYREIMGLGKVVIPVINKIDDLNEELYNAIKNEIKNEQIFEISAEKNTGINELLNYALKLLSKQSEVLDN